MADTKKRFKVILDRPACIGAATCVAAAAKHWKMAEDGKVDLLDSKRSADNAVQEKSFDAADLEEMKLAAESCPVHAIRIIDTETGEELV